MRTIYTIFLAMLFFNVFFIAFSPYFDITGTDTEINAVNISEDKDLLSYKMGSIDVIALGLTLAATFIAAFGASAVVNRLGAATISIPLGTIIAFSIISTIFTATWISLASVFEPILKYGNVDGGINLVAVFYNLFQIAFGIIFALTLAELFAGQSGVDT